MKSIFKNSLATFEALMRAPLCTILNLVLRIQLNVSLVLVFEEFLSCYVHISKAFTVIGLI